MGNDEAGWEALHAALAAACTGAVTVAYWPIGGGERGMVRHLCGVGTWLRPASLQALSPLVTRTFRSDGRDVPRR